MLLLALVACYERVLLDVRVDTHGQEVCVVVQQQGVDDQIGESSCHTAAECLDAIKAHLAQERGELEGQGAHDVRNGVWLRDGELDFVSGYYAGFDAQLLAGGGPLRVVGTTDARGVSRKAAVIWQEPDGDGGRTTVRATGKVAAFTIQETGTLWTLGGAHPTAHLEYQVRSDGKDVVVEPWVAGVAGLTEAIQGSGLLLDPATLTGKK